MTPPIVVNIGGGKGGNELPTDRAKPSHELTEFGRATNVM